MRSNRCKQLKLNNEQWSLVFDRQLRLRWRRAFVQIVNNSNALIIKAHNKKGYELKPRACSAAVDWRVISNSRATLLSTLLFASHFTQSVTRACKKTNSPSHSLSLVAPHMTHDCHTRTLFEGQLHRRCHPHSLADRLLLLQSLRLAFKVE